MLDMSTEGTLVVIMVLSAGLLLLGFVLGWLGRSKFAHSKTYRAEVTAEKILDDAEKEAESMKRTAVLEAKDQMHQEAPPV